MTDTSSEPDIDSPELIHWSPKRGPSVGSLFRLPSGSSSALAGVAVGAAAVGAIAVGAMAIGALAIGTLALGQLAIGRTTLRQVRIGRLVVDDLVVLKRSTQGD